MLVSRFVIEIKRKTVVFYWQPTYSGDELVFSIKIKPQNNTNHLESNPQIEAKQVAYIISCFLRLCHVIFCTDLKTTFCSIINTTFKVYIIVISQQKGTRR